MKGESWKWLFLFSGICGSLLLLQSAQGLTWNDRAVYVAEAGILISLWIFFEILVKWHWPVYLCVTGLMLGSALVGIEWKMSTLFFLVIFQFSFWIFYNPGKSGGSLPLSVLGRMSLFLPAVFFLAAAVLVHWKTEWFYQAAYQVEGTVRKNIKRASGVSEDFADGVVNRGNIYPAGIEQIRVRVSKEPSEEMYLKDFTGGIYTDGIWEQAEDEILFERMNRNTLHWNQWEGWIQNLYESLYFAMNRGMQDQRKADSRELFIVYHKALAENWLEPYYSRWDKYYQNSENDAEYRMEYFEQGEIEIDWGKVNRYFETARDWYHEVQDAYLKEARIIYTDVPKETLSGLVSLCANYPIEDQEEVSKFICDYLQENILYTRTPGRVPYHADPVEYFLFEKKEGYCQHFASAAVLMYRLYGIPARYAAGYRIAPADFERQEDGSWQAVVTDESAHAWPEIFVEDHGWLPVEVTVDMQNEQEPAQVREGRQADGSRRLEGGPASSEDSKQQTYQKERAETEYEQRPTGQDGRISKAAVKVFIGCIKVLVILVLLESLLWNYRIKWSWMRKGGCVRFYGRLLRAIHAAGYLREYDGSEKEFSGKLSEAFPVISREEAERLVEDVNEEVFGRPAPSNSEKIDFAEDVYRRIRKTIFSNREVFKKIWF